MTIETSYFASKAPKERMVCIAKWNRFWKGARANDFAPSNPKATDWANAYRADLERRFPTSERLAQYLRKIEKETPNPILCCYEKDENECHRRILAAFVQERIGIDIQEWQPTEPPLSQCSLF